jgi:hypothetical protein
LKKKLEKFVFIDYTYDLYNSCIIYKM